jgi:hypothetical protein
MKKGITIQWYIREKIKKKKGSVGEWGKGKLQ